MSEPTHHAPDAMLAAYAAGSLPYPFAVLVAAHVSACDECRARLEAHLLMGGVVLERAPRGGGFGDAARTARWRRLASRPFPCRTIRRSTSIPRRSPSCLGGTPPAWQPLGFGTKQAILWRGGEGTVRLLSIPAGQAVPDHGHRGLELTLVLSGSFSDEGGTFQAGDLEVADETVVHVPTAGEGAPCICAAATDAPIRFRALIPRLLQPLLRI